MDNAMPPWGFDDTWQEVNLQPGIPLPVRGDHLIVQRVLFHVPTQRVYIVLHLFAGFYQPPAVIVVHYRYWQFTPGFVLPVVM
jgi:hypothetical protein